MDKKPHGPPAAGRRRHSRSKPLDDELQRLYAIYGKGEPSQRVKQLARDLGEAGAKRQKTARAKPSSSE